ncbi:unnamed protein product, partial [Effrenium voratum]
AKVYGAPRYDAGRVLVQTLSPQMGQRALSRGLSKVSDQDYGEGVEVHIADKCFVCLSALGRGSYGEVWRAKVVTGASEKEVALKEVLCRSQGELQQAIFEVQVLLALERDASPLRVPRCICYKVASCVQGWRVRTAMTVAPGESLDYYIRRPNLHGFAMSLRRALALVANLLRDIGPALQRLGPIAWHRDVNSHNILIDGAPDEADEVYLSANSTFWLIDFGLAVDSQSWVSENGKWRTEYIGGDSRYWPPSSWIMHLVGPEGFDDQPELCQQYQRRLDIHGLGITALELLCSVAMPECAEERELQPWTPIFRAWQNYREVVWQWWSLVYEVFSRGGDLAPVQAQLVEERLVDRLLELLRSCRQALRGTAASCGDPSAQRLLLMIADMLDEGKDFDLQEIQRLLGPQRKAKAKEGPSEAEQLSAILPGYETLMQRMQSLHKLKTTPPAADAVLEQKLGQLRRQVVGKARWRLLELAQKRKASVSSKALSGMSTPPGGRR